jgi:hypothetical protein
MVQRPKFDSRFPSLYLIPKNGGGVKLESVAYAALLLNGQAHLSFCGGPSSSGSPPTLGVCTPQNTVNQFVRSTNPTNKTVTAITLNHV